MVLRDPVPSSVTGVPVLPTTVQEAFVKSDYLHRESWDPYQQAWKLHQNTGTLQSPSYSSTFALSATTTSLSSEQIVLNPELRRLAIDANTDLEVILHLDTVSVSSDASISVGLWSASSGGTQYGSDEILTGTGSSTGSQTTGGDVAILRLSFPANSNEDASLTNVPEYFYVRFTRTAGSATVSDSFVYIDEADQGGGAVGGADEPWEVIWSAGPGNTSRRTASSSTFNLNLITGRRFDQYRWIEIHFDNNATPGIGFVQPVSYGFIDNALTQNLAGVNGSLIISVYSFYKAIKFINQTTFRIWQGNNELGIRRIRGLP